MTDAFDVWFQLSPATLIARYQELGTTDVILGADKGCWPNSPDSVSVAAIQILNSLSYITKSLRVWTFPSPPFPRGSMVQFGPGDMSPHRGPGTHFAL